LLLCIAKLWESFEDAKWTAVKEGAIEKICTLLTDPVPEVRAATLYAIGLFIGGAENQEDRMNVDYNIALTLLMIIGSSFFF
jgi:regulator-associated protein of mTOR